LTEVEQARVVSSVPIRILFVDDEREIVAAFTRYFAHRGFETVAAHGVAEAVATLEAASTGSAFDVVCTDLRMPDGDGLEVVRAVRRLQPGCPAVVLTAYGSVSASVQALRLGAVTMLEKPIVPSELERELQAAIADGKRVPQGLDAVSAAGLVGRAPALVQLLDSVARVAPSTSTVLLVGESGTGKERVAQAVHRLSRRADGPLVAVNCAAIPEPLLESELFGHVRGAFTGAVAARTGRFKLAHGGTLFLDEIGELPLVLQSKLLRVLQEREIEPVGAEKPEPVDFRLVAATNRDLEQLVAEGKFRSDLFYRLNVVPLRLPALRERPGDVALLARHFLARHAPQATFSADALAALERHSWPGNVRELENLVERLAVLKGDGEIGLPELPAPLGAPSKERPAVQAVLPPEGVDLYAVLRELEDRLITEALDRVNGNKKQASKLLGLNRTTLVEKLKKRQGEPR
jgi:DNA-binding NtrC family response regulator